MRAVSSRCGPRPAARGLSQQAPTGPLPPRGSKGTGPHHAQRSGLPGGAYSPPQPSPAVPRGAPPVGRYGLQPHIPRALASTLRGREVLCLPASRTQEGRRGTQVELQGPPPRPSPDLLLSPTPTSWTPKGLARPWTWGGGGLGQPWEGGDLALYLGLLPRGRVGAKDREG